MKANEGELKAIVSGSFPFIAFHWRPLAVKQLVVFVIPLQRLLDFPARSG